MKFKVGEKGFTLIELLVGIAIAAFVVGAASMTVITMMRLSPQTNNWAIALRQVQNAGHWISRDVQMARTIEPDTDPETPTFLTLTVPEWDDDLDEVVNKTLVYEFKDINGEQWLVRTEKNSGGSIVGQTAIAQYISDTDANYTDNCTLTFTITATSGDVPVTVTRDYEAMQRVPSP